MTHSTQRQPTRHKSRNRAAHFLVALLAIHATASGPFWFPHVEATSSFVKRYDLDRPSLLRRGPPTYSQAQHANLPDRHFITRRLFKRLAKRENTGTSFGNATTTEPNELIVDFHCDITHLPKSKQSVIDDLCNKARNGFSRAAAFISAVLRLRSPIYVNATFRSFCSLTGPNSEPKCDKRTLGSAAPASFYEFDNRTAALVGADDNYQYPSALFRQMVSLLPKDDQNAATLKRYDILAEFNAVSNWWFAESSGKIKANEYDFEQVLCHEFLHGAGFISSWFPWLATKRYDAEEAELSTEENTVLKTELPENAMLLPAALERAEDGSIVGIGKQYIFNKFMADNVKGKWLKDYAKEIVDSVKRQVLKSDDYFTWRQRFLASDAAQVCTTMFDVGRTPERVVFWYPRWSNFMMNMDFINSTDNNIVWDYKVLYTPSKYSDGSSLSHFDDDFYKGTTEFLMRPTATAGIAMKNYVPVVSIFLILLN